VSTIATGQLEQFLSALLSLAQLEDKHEEVQCMLLLRDVLVLLGIDRELFQERRDETPLLPNLIHALFKGVPDKVEKEELEKIVNKLVNLLLGLCVSAPADVINKLITELVEPLEAYAKKLVEGDKSMEDASSDLIGAARLIATTIADGKSLSHSKMSDTTLRILGALLRLLMPFLPDTLERPLKAMLQVFIELAVLQANPTLEAFTTQMPDIIDNIREALSVPGHNIRGIFALARGDWAEAADLCRPFCDLDAAVFDQMSRLLPMVQKTMASGKEIIENLQSEGFDDEVKRNSGLQSRLKRISQNVAQGKGTTNDLFDMIDVDRNGGISREEFKICTVRLGLKLSDHRILEIFSKCKKKKAAADRGVLSADPLQELTQEEFKAALEYLQHKIAGSSMTLLGRSWGRLMVYLAFLTFVLVLIFVFLFLGMSAFTPGGTFQAVVNSVMTISAGISLFRTRMKEASGDSNDQAKTSSMVEEVTDTVFNDQ